MSIFEMPDDLVAESDFKMTSRQIARSRRALSRLATSEAGYAKFLNNAVQEISQHGNVENLTPLILNSTDAARIQPPPWLIENIIPKKALVLLYGKEGQGKSFLVLDMLFSIARGKDFLGNAVTQGPVVYVVAEGVTGIGKRIKAYLTKKTQYGVLTGLAVPLFIIPEALQLNTDMGVQRLLLALADIQQPPAAIVIDTLHACMQTADENSAHEIGQFITVANRIRSLSGSSVIVIHHTRKSGDSYRGHSSLAGDVDTMIRVTKESREDGDVLIKTQCTKQKDGSPFDEFYCKLTTVKLDDGETSCIVEPTVTIVEPSERMIHIMQILGKHPNGMTYTDLRNESGMPEKAFLTWRARLLTEGLVKITEDKMYHLTPLGGKWKVAR